MKKRKPGEVGCPYCHGNGGCYGQCEERFKAQVKMIVAPLLKLRKEIRTALARKPRKAKEGAR